MKGSFKNKQGRLLQMHTGSFQVGEDGGEGRARCVLGTKGRGEGEEEMTGSSF